MGVARTSEGEERCGSKGNYHDLGGDGEAEEDKSRGKQGGQGVIPPMQSLMGWPSSPGCWWEVSGWIDPFSSATKLFSC